MIDTTDPQGDRAGADLLPGQEHHQLGQPGRRRGEVRARLPHRQALTARRWWCGTIDEDKLQAQAFTRERKLAVAQRSRAAADRKVRHSRPRTSSSIRWCSPAPPATRTTSAARSRPSKRIRLVKENIPYVKTVLGISNISLRTAGGGARSGELGLPLPLHQGRARSGHRQRGEAGALRVASRRRAAPGRESAVQHAAGERRRRIAAHRAGGLARSRRANRRPPSTSSTSPPSRSISARPARASKQHAADLPLDQRLANYIIEGTKDGLIADLDRKRAEGATPLDIINGPLMAGMSEVGRLFNNNELIVAEVLQSAEAMKAAVNHLEQFMEKADTAARGKVVLATVKGDVHDIGKNLVEIILANNGYDVVNLGIKVPPDVLIQACARAPARRHRSLRPAGEERAADGDHGDRLQGQRASACRCWWAARRSPRSSRAPRSRRPTATPVCYAKDAMTGLRLMNRADGPGGSATASLASAHVHGSARGGGSARGTARAGDHARAAARCAPTSRFRPRRIWTAACATCRNLAEVWSYINPFMLYGRHLGFKGNFEKAAGGARTEGAGTVPQRGRGEAARPRSS